MHVTQTAHVYVVKMKTWLMCVLVFLSFLVFAETGSKLFSSVVYVCYLLLFSNMLQKTTVVLLVSFITLSNTIQNNYKHMNI